MFLANKFLERARSHSRRERSGWINPRNIVFRLLAEQIVHREKVAGVTAFSSGLTLPIGSRIFQKLALGERR
jgi:hypothetical protein